MIAVEEEEKEEKEKEKEKKEEKIHIKSSNPHLTGGEKLLTNFHGHRGIVSG